jgi:uncharacterized phiE125 gp8 family phage protein
MQRTIVVPAVLPGAALDELKQWLAIRSATDDAALLRTLRTALDMCEAFIGAAALPCTFEETLPAACDWQALSTRPVSAIVAVSGLTAQNMRTTLPVDAYEIDIDAEGAGRVRLLRDIGTARMVVRAAAGIAPSWDLLPDGLRHGLVRLAAHTWRARDTASDAGPPAAVAALWRPWRRMRL